MGVFVLCRFLLSRQRLGKVRRSSRRPRSQPSSSRHCIFIFRHFHLGNYLIILLHKPISVSKTLFFQAGCAFFAFQRFRQGADAAFAPSYEVEGALGGGGGYSSYPGAPDPDPAYQDPPFTQQRGINKNFPTKLIL